MILDLDYDDFYCKMDKYYNGNIPNPEVYPKQFMQCVKIFIHVQLCIEREERIQREEYRKLLHKSDNSLTII